MRLPRVLLGASLVAVAAASWAQPPRAVAELFGRGVFSTGDYELPPTFSRDGRTAYFTVSTPAYGRMRFIMETRRQGERWSEPTVAPFSGRYDDADPYFSPDGSKLFFLSKRPVTPGGPPKRDLDIWVMDRAGGGWGEPRHLGARVNGPSDEHYVTMTNDGTLYIAAVRADSRNQGDLYRIPLVDGEYGEPQNLGPAVNGAEQHDTTPWVSPDGSYIIFGSRGRPDSRGDIDLYITTRGADGQWTAPRNLGPGVNSPSTDYCPLVSPDGRWLYFSSTRYFADSGLAAPLTARALRERIRNPGNSLGDTYRVALPALLAELGITPRAE
jgi:Tol biopolymer transport system component